MSIAAYDQLLSNLAQRFGINDAKTLRKSKELLSLLGSKHSLSCSEACKVIICLELGASLTSVNFSRENAIKLSGCSKRNYVNLFNNISKLLNLDKVYTIKEICLLVGVSQVCDSAVDLFKKYKTLTPAEPSVLEHPMYGCAAVLAVCHEERQTINLTKLIEISRINKLNLKKLTDKFRKLYEKKSVDSTNNKNSPEKDVNVQKCTKKMTEYSKDEDDDQMTDEKFRDWKRRMLEGD